MTSLRNGIENPFVLSRCFGERILSCVWLPVCSSHVLPVLPCWPHESLPIVFLGPTIFLGLDYHSACFELVTFAWSRCELSRVIPRVLTFWKNPYLIWPDNMLSMCICLCPYLCGCGGSRASLGHGTLAQRQDLFLAWHWQIRLGCQARECWDLPLCFAGTRITVFAWPFYMCFGDWT